MQWPIWIAQQFAREEDEIRATLCHDGVGLMRLDDHADGGGGNSGFFADACGERRLIGGADLDSRIGNEAARRDIDKINAMGAENAREPDRFIDGPSAICPICRGDANKERQVDRPRGSNRMDDLEQETNAILEGAAVGISALIGERRQKLM